MGPELTSPQAILAKVACCSHNMRVMIITIASLPPRQCFLSDWYCRISHSSLFTRFLQLLSYCLLSTDLLQVRSEAAVDRQEQ